MGPSDHQQAPSGIPTATPVQPVPAQRPIPTATPVMGVPQPLVSQATVQIGQPVTAARGRWNHPLLDCCEGNMCVCFSVLMCMPTTTVQLYERVRGQPGSCVKVGLVLWVLYAVTVATMWISTDTARAAGCTYEEPCTDQCARRRHPITPPPPIHLSTRLATTTAPTLSWRHRLAGIMRGLSQISWMTGWGMTFAIVYMLRQRIIARDRIPSEGIVECCITWWCTGCAQCQMWRQEGFDVESPYSLCSTDGGSTREIELHLEPEL